MPRQVRDAARLRAGDVVSYEVRGEDIVLRKVAPFDLAFHRALESTLTEWPRAEDEEAFRNL